MEIAKKLKVITVKNYWRRIGQVERNLIGYMTKFYHWQHLWKISKKYTITNK